MLQIIPVLGIPVISSEDQIWNEIRSQLLHVIQDDDILVCAHTPWSRIRGPIYEISEIEPSDHAIALAESLNKDPQKIEVILRESKSVVKTGRNIIISENNAGVVCANAGVDQSNAGIGKLIGVPENPDKLALEIRTFIKEKLGKEVAVIISDTTGRALRKGAVNIAIGVSGLNPMKSEIGKKDLFGYEMRVSEIAVADELASTAELVQGQRDEGIPMVIVRGYNYEKSENISARILNRPDNERLFR